MAILAQVPGSVLWLCSAGPACEANLRREAAARGVAPGRLVFVGRRPPDEYLAQHRLADLFLDTHLYNGHSTVSMALWAGLPVLTCPGSTFASRVGASLLTAVGLPELIAAGLDDYQRIAVALARDPDALRRLRARLAEHRAVLAVVRRAPLRPQPGAGLPRDVGPLRRRRAAAADHRRRAHLS